MLKGVFVEQYSINLCTQMIQNFLVSTVVYSANAFAILDEDLFFFPNSAILDIHSTSDGVAKIGE